MRTQERGYIPFGLLLLLGMGLALWIQVWMYLEVVDRTIGNIPLIGMDEASWALRNQPRVAILRSDASAQMAGDRAEYYYGLAEEWRLALEEAGLPARFISDRELAAGLVRDADVLVLPMAACLSDAQRSSIEAFASRSKGLVMSGPLGVREANCAWRGWEYLTDLTGLKFAAAELSDDVQYLAFRGRNWYSGGVPTALSVPVVSTELITGIAEGAPVYLSDGRLRPVPGEVGQERTVALRGQTGNSRFVWFGFPETLPVPSHVARMALRAYLVSSALWVSYSPLAYVEDWPGGKSVAVLLGAAVTNVEGARSTASLMRREMAPVTFFCDPREFGSAALLNELGAAGEVGVTIQSEILAEEAQETQRAKLAGARAQIGAVLSRDGIGFLPPASGWDERTRQAIAAAGFRYFVDSWVSSTAEVDTAGIGYAADTKREEPVFPLAHVSDDDFQLLAGVPGDADIRDALVSEAIAQFHHARSVGGLHSLLFRTDLLGSAEYQDALRQIVRQFRSEESWIATGRDLVDWLRGRAMVSVDTRTLGPRRIRLAVTNKGNAALNNVAVRVELPRPTDRVRIIPSILGRNVPELELDPKRQSLRLRFESLAGYTSSVLVLVLDDYDDYSLN